MKITIELNVEEFNQIGGKLADVINAMTVEETEEDCCDDEIKCYGSQYARYFDESCTGWTKDPNFNKVFCIAETTVFYR